MEIPYGSSLFAGMDRDEAEASLKRMEIRSVRYHKNEVIFSGDEQIEEMGIILKGRVLIGKETVSGNKTVIALLEPGSFLGEVMAITGNPITNTVISYSDETEILFLPVRSLMDDSRLAANLIQILAQKALYLNRRVYYLQLKTIRGKIAKFILEESRNSKNSTFRTAFNHQVMSEYLNVSRPSLSRELSRLKEEGVIDYYKETIKILDQKALEAMQE